jgi:hypothetical protein
MNVGYPRFDSTCFGFVGLQDHARKDIVLCMRGLNLLNVQDYVTLADTRIGSKAYDGGFVHRGLFAAASWLMGHEAGRSRTFENLC